MELFSRKGKQERMFESLDIKKLSFILEETWTNFSCVLGNATWTHVQLRLTVEYKHFGMPHALY